MTNITAQVIREQFVTDNMHVEWDSKYEIARVCYFGDEIIDECEMADLITLRNLLDAVITCYGSRDSESVSKTGLENFLDARGRVLK